MKWFLPGTAFLLLIVGTWLRWSYPQQWLLPNETDSSKDGPAYSPYMVEADAYTRLVRVQRILNGEGLIQSFHPHENYPTGITPSTTLPFDLVILTAYAPLSLALAEPLDWAGAIAAWLLFPACLALAYYWSAQAKLHPGVRLTLLAGIALAPGLIWATPFARPDHQALVLFLLLGALLAEGLRWNFIHEDDKLWPAIGGVCWGLALWTSLFEPLLLLVIILATNLIVRRREQSAFLIALGVSFGIALIVEGGHLATIISQTFTSAGDSETRRSLGYWFETIGELKPMLSVTSLLLNVSVLLFVLPLAIVRLYLRKDLRTEEHLMVGLSLLLFMLTVFQARWIYFSTLLMLLVVVLWMQREKLRWLKATALLALVIGWSWSSLAFLNLKSGPAERPLGPQMKKLAQAAQDGGAVMAPYWLGPQFMYFSGRPIVGSSSHLTIDGIVDSSRYYTTTNWRQADDILQRREVDWVLTYVPERVHSMSSIVLDGEVTVEPAEGLGNMPLVFRLHALAAVPTRYKLASVQPDLRLFRYVAPRKPSSPTSTASPNSVENRIP